MNNNFFTTNPANNNSRTSTFEFRSIADAEIPHPTSSNIGEVIEFRSNTSQSTPDPEPPLAA